MTSSVARIKFIKTKVIFSYHTKRVSNQISSNSDYKVKSYLCSKPTTKMGKNKKMETDLPRLQNGPIRGLQIGTGFRDYKSGHKGLQIGEALWITN